MTLTLNKQVTSCLDIAPMVSPAGSQKRRQRLPTPSLGSASPGNGRFNL